MKFLFLFLLFINNAMAITDCVSRIAALDNTKFSKDFYNSVAQNPIWYTHTYDSLIFKTNFCSYPESTENDLAGFETRIANNDAQYALSTNSRLAITSPGPAGSYYRSTGNLSFDWAVPSIGAGNISVPASSTVNNVVLWNATNGTQIKDSAVSIVSGVIYSLGLVLNGETVIPFTASLKTQYDNAVAQYHMNFSLLNSYTQTDVNLASAVQLKHTHEICFLHYNAGVGGDGGAIAKNVYSTIPFTALSTCSFASLSSNIITFSKIGKFLISGELNFAGAGEKFGRLYDITAAAEIARSAPIATGNINLIGSIMVPSLPKSFKMEVTGTADVPNGLGVGGSFTVGGANIYRRFFIEMYDNI